MAAAKSHHFDKVSLMLSLGLGLFLGGLAMIGVNVNIWLGGLVLLVAFVLLAASAWLTFHGFGRGIRVCGIALVAVPSFGFVARQMAVQYHKEHEVSFVFIAPGPVVGDQRNFFVGHRGPKHNFNVQIMFSEMAPQFMNHSFSREEIAKTTKTLAFSEVDSNVSIGPPLGFAWVPVSNPPDRQDYWIDISYRGGGVSERIQAALVENKWRYAVQVLIPNTNVYLIECMDSAFPALTHSMKRLGPCSPGI